MKHICLITLVILFSFLGYLSIWCVLTVGDISFEKIVFHMFMPLRKIHLEWLETIYIPILGAIITSVILGYAFKKQKEKIIRPLMVLLLFCILFDGWYINKHFFVWDFIKTQFESSNFIENHYVSPKDRKMTFPEKKRNLIVIMVESLETSYQDKKSGGLFNKNHIPELTRLAKQNISFSHSDKLDGAIVPPEAGWTIAATVAQTAGIPLKLYGPLKTNNKERKIDNSMGKFKHFLPGITSLGDILLQQGYHNYFILGTDAKYAGKSDYLTQHGSYKIYDHKALSNKQNITDSNLFKIIQNLMPNISQNQPFSILIQTADTHFAPQKKFNKVSKNVFSFVKWIRKQPFYKDTTIVIVGDHCNMLQKDFNGLEQEDFRYSGNMERKVYNAFLNADAKPIKTTYRRFSTFDMFPTILASIGVRIEGNKLGLGTNLFSEEKTLFEKYDSSYIFTELKKKSHWYNKTLLYPSKK